MQDFQLKKSSMSVIIFLLQIFNIGYVTIMNSFTFFVKLIHTEPFQFHHIIIPIKLLLGFINHIGYHNLIALQQLQKHVPSSVIK